MALNYSIQTETGGKLPTLADLLAATPEDRYAYLTQNNTPGISAAMNAALNLRNVTQDGGNQPLTPEQYQQILTSSNLDPATQQQISQSLGQELDFQKRAAADDSLTRHAIIGGAAFLGGGLGANALLGTGASGGATAGVGAGLEAGGATGAPAVGLMPAAVPEVGGASTGASAATAAGTAGTLGANSGMWTALGIGGAGVVGAGLQYQAAKDAANMQAAAADRSIAEQSRQYDLTRADNAPFLQTGTAANQRLATLLGLQPGTDSGSLLRKFSAADLEADPVYQSGLKFGLDRGTEGINARATAGGMFDSGATLKALTQFGNDYGSTKANESFNRYNAQNDSIFNKLSGVSGSGQVATQQVGAAGANMANNVSNDLTGAGNARAAGIVGGANAWNNALTGGYNAFNNYQNNQTLQALLSRPRY